MRAATVLPGSRLLGLVGRFAPAVLSLAGAAFFAFLLLDMGAGPILASVARLGWRLALVLVFPFVLVNLFDTLGWRFAFRRDRASFWNLMRTRLAGEAINITTPTATLGGEGVKAWLLRPTVPLRETVPSLVVAKTTMVVSELLLLLVGLAFAPPVLAGSSLLHAMRWLCVVEIVAVGGFIGVQMGGTFARGRTLLHRFGVVGSSAGARTASRVDHALLLFYRRAPARLVLSTACHFTAWLMSAFETWVILWALGVPASPVTALVIEAFGTGVRFATFFVPAHLGALEGGHVLTFVALGLGGSLGMSFSLVRRLREAAWVGAGLLLMSGPALRRLVARAATEG